MPTPNRDQRWTLTAVPDSTTLLLLTGAGLLVVAAVAWVGAVLATLLTAHTIPDGGLAAALTALLTPADPGQAWPHPNTIPGPVLYWTVTAVVVLTVAAATYRVRRVIRESRPDPVRARLARLPGLARPADAERVAGQAALLARASVVRPSHPDPEDPREVGYYLGAVRRRPLWCSVEDSALLVGPPRMGKGMHVVIPWVLDAPGPVIATSTRPDTLAITRATRATRGPVAVFDPQRLAGLPDGLAWSPVRGCHRPRTALVRARGLAAGAGYGASVSDADFWSGQTETALRCLLHAAALDGRSATELYRWSLNPVLAEDAVTILTRNTGAADGWADALDAIVHVDPRTRDSIWLGVRQALAALADPDVLAAVTPRQGHEFSPQEFLTGTGTLYLLASAVASGSSAPLIAAFVEDITETARTLAARAPAGRLDPPLLLALDEIANLTPLPSLPALMAEGGGIGITTLAVLQSLAQARHRWGEHSADAIWDAATVKLVLGGLGKYRDLEDIARLLGEIDEPTQTLSRDRDGHHSATTSLRTVPVMHPAVLRTLPVGVAVLLLRHTRPVLTDLTAWIDRPDAGDLHAAQHDYETQVRDNATTRTPR